jgi:cell division protein YceG involved in septum cleavage
MWKMTWWSMMMMMMMMMMVVMMMMMIMMMSRLTRLLSVLPGSAWRRAVHLRPGAAQDQLRQQLATGGLAESKRVCRYVAIPGTISGQS